MNWGDERYVRIYTRDTSDWLSLSFIAQGLFCLILRKVDRAGVMKLGRHGRRAVAITIGHAGDWSRLEPALDELVADGCVRIVGDCLVVPNFIEAQEAPATEAQRQRESRATRRELALAAQAGLIDPGASRCVTENHETGQNVTTGHGASQVVTPSRAVPSRAVPPLTTDATVTRLPTKAEALARQYPATAKLCEEGGFSFPSKPETRATVESSILAVGHAAALAAARASFAANGKTHLGWHLDAIRGASRTTTTTTEDPAVDLSWVQALPPDRQDAAMDAWMAAAADVASQFKPEARPRALASAAAMLRQEFAS